MLIIGYCSSFFLSTSSIIAAGKDSMHFSFLISHSLNDTWNCLSGWKILHFFCKYSLSSDHLIWCAWSLLPFLPLLILVNEFVYFFNASSRKLVLAFILLFSWPLNIPVFNFEYCGIHPSFENPLNTLFIFCHVCCVFLDVLFPSLSPLFCSPLLSLGISVCCSGSLPTPHQQVGSGSRHVIVCRHGLWGEVYFFMEP